jgi:L-alanine-DL-glutamate epimerase-like enolase superfamily enzyme
MKITDVRVQRYAQSKAQDGSPAGAEIQIVDLDTDEGVSGRGFLTASNSSTSPNADLYVTLLRRNLRNIVLDQDPVLTDQLWRRMYDQFAGRRGARGLVLGAIAAIDFAAWDIKAKMMGRPLGDLFGARRERIPTYANAAHQSSPEAVAETATEYVKKGHKAIKIRGARTVGTPVDATRRLQAAREAVGPDIKLMIDVNGTWDVDTAIQQLKAWQPYDLYWLEEPVPPEDIRGYVRVKEHAGDTYIVGGEQHSGLAEFSDLLQQDAVDIVQPGAGMVGGITEWLRVYQMATAFGVPVSPWNLQAVHIHMAAGLSKVKWIEYFMPDNPMLEFQNRLFKEPMFREETTDEGVFLLPPEKPGLGLVLDEAEAEQRLVRE